MAPDGSAVYAFGPMPWAVVLGAATVVALWLDAKEEAGGVGSPLARTGSILLFGASGVWAVWLAWQDPSSSSRRLWEAVAWWLPVVPLLWLGAQSARAGGSGSLSRLAAAQAVPAILLTFAPALGFRSIGALAAGVARVAVPPLHPLNQSAAEALAPGSLTLGLVLGLVVGGPVAVRGTAGSPDVVVNVVLAVIALAAGFVGAASIRDGHALRRIGTWAAVQGALGVLMVSVPTVATGRDPGEVSLAHFGACAIALPLIGLTLGRVVAFTRVSDLRAQGGLGAESPWRARILMTSAFFAVLASSWAAVALTNAIGADTGMFPRMLYVAGLVGWFGSNLAIVLGAYRMVRGVRTTPGDPVPEVDRLEMVLTAILFGIALVGRWVPGLWESPQAWSLRLPGL